MELRDYNGEFDPNVKLEDFSKEFLARIMREWGAAYMRVGEAWYNAARKKLSEEDAIECELEIWAGKPMEITLPRIAKAMNLQPKTILDVLKVWQLIPDGLATGLHTASYEIKNENHIIWNIERCGTMEYYERAGQPERLMAMCHKIDPAALDKYLKALLPNAEIKPLKLPSGPRQDPTESPVCTWELKLES